MTSHYLNQSWYPVILVWTLLGPILRYNVAGSPHFVQRIIMDLEGVSIGPFTGFHGLGPFPDMFKSSHCNSLEDGAPVDFIYGCPVFKWVAETWLMTEYQDNSPNNGKHTQLTTKQYGPRMLHFTPNIMDPLLLGIVSSMAITCWN